MSRSAAFYVVKAMERTAAGTTVDQSRAPRMQADHDAPETIRARGDQPSLVRRAFAAVSGGSAPRRAGHRRLGRALRAD
jgi:hypothetical protein